MKLKSIKETVAKIVKSWSEVNLAPESIKEDVENFLAKQKETVILLSLGFKRDNWNHEIKELDHGKSLIKGIIADNCETAAKDWLKDSGVVFSEIELSKAQRNHIIKTYKDNLVDSLDSMAKNQAEDDAKRVYNDIIEGEVAKVAKDFEAGNIQLRQPTRW